MFLKLYNIEAINASIAGCDEKTFRYWSWTLVHVIAMLENLVDWDNRNIGDNGSVCRASTDGTDFRIKEQYPFDGKWCSHKFKGPGLRYEVAIGIQNAWIVWINGPFPAGAWPDLKITRSSLAYFLDDGEKLLADKGYVDGNRYMETPDGTHDFDQRQKATVRARHETCNARFKSWGALNQTFRHKPAKHSDVFHAIANITQLEIMTGETSLFEVEYDDSAH